MTLKVYYHDQYNFRLGLLARLHPFDGLKFEKAIVDLQATAEAIELTQPDAALLDEDINAFVDSLQKLLLNKKGYILRALELPKIPLLPFSWLDNHILAPMRWASAGTVAAATSALKGDNCWNLSGGYHHASRAKSEGFCIYNDIGITLDSLRRDGSLSSDDPVLIIDTDAHHGNGNAYTFLEDKAVTLFDIYNNDIYPNTPFTKERVDINVPLECGTKGNVYLHKLTQALAQLQAPFKLAFVVAGTDVLDSDPLGGLSLSVEECAQRDSLVAKALLDTATPFVFLGGGGYSKESYKAIAEGVRAVSKL